MSNPRSVLDPVTQEARTTAARVPLSAVFQRALARRVLDVLTARWTYGTLEVQLPDGTQRECRGRLDAGVHASWRIDDWGVFGRLLGGGDVALGETYVDGQWDTPDLNALLALFCRNEAALGSAAAGSWLARLRRLAEHVANTNTKRGSRRNIAYHYDLGNAFYRLWLDPGMTYSAAVFAHDDEDLDAAQTRKYARLADALDIAPEQRVLEIGCGWGAFAEYLAGTRGARVHGVSISRAQVEYAARRIADAGLGDRAHIELRDYRDLDGRYDRIVSVEMFEAVGERYWADYARVLRERLAPGGSAGLQVITIAPERFEGYRRRPDFIQRHVFPGGMLPSIPKLNEVMAGAGLAVTDEFRFGLDYALTLARWRERFDAAWPAIAAQGFDARFRRLWRYYLAYCEVGFREGAIDVVQIRVEPR